MKSSGKYNQQLSRISDKHDKLESASTISEAKDNIIQLQEIEKYLLFMERDIVDAINALTAIKNKQRPNSLISSLFRKTKDEEADIDSKIELYDLELTFANSIRSIIGQVTIPKLKAYIRQEEQKSKTAIDYFDYIKSTAWKQKAEEAKARAGNRCQVCNRSRAEVQLDAHHRTYDHLGNEKPEDITVLCRECHQLYEDEKKDKQSSKQCKRCKQSFISSKASYLYCATCFPIIKQQEDFKPQQNENGKSTTIPGICIRCQKKIKLNPQAPYCYSCFKSWSKYQNKEHQEKFCHICGKENKSSMLKPVCQNCYRKYRDQ